MDRKETLNGYDSNQDKISGYWEFETMPLKDQEDTKAEFVAIEVYEYI